LILGLWVGLLTDLAISGVGPFEFFSSLAEGLFLISGWKRMVPRLHLPLCACDVDGTGFVCNPVRSGKSVTRRIYSGTFTTSGSDQIHLSLSEMHGVFIQGILVQTGGGLDENFLQNVKSPPYALPPPCRLNIDRRIILNHNVTYILYLVSYQSHVLLSIFFFIIC